MSYTSPRRPARACAAVPQPWPEAFEDRLDILLGVMDLEQGVEGSRHSVLKYYLNDLCFHCAGYHKVRL